MARRLKWLQEALHAHYRKLPAKTLAKAMVKGLNCDDRDAIYSHGVDHLRKSVEQAYGTRGKKTTAVLREIERRASRCRSRR